MAEKETENFESFNVVSDFYLPLMETEQKYSSPILKDLEKMRLIHTNF